MTTTLHQSRLEISVDERMRCLRALQAGSPFAKLLLMMLDHHIGKGREDRDGGRRVYSWTIHPNDLAEECEMSRSSAYKWLEHLESEGFIEWRGKEIIGRIPTFFINWPCIIQRVDDEDSPAKHTACQKAAAPSLPVRLTDDPVRHTDWIGAPASPPHGLAVRETDSAVRVADNPVRETDCNIEERTLSALKAPSSAPGAADDDDGEKEFSKFGEDSSELTREDVVELVKRTGVSLADDAVDQAQLNGMTLEAAAAIAQHALKHPGWYDPRVVHSTLTHRAALGKLPDKALEWGKTPGRGPATAPQAATAAESGPSITELQREHLATLQAMNLDDLQKLLPFVESGIRKRVAPMLNRAEDPRQGTLIDRLLEALHRRRQRDGPSATSTA